MSIKNLKEKILPGSNRAINKARLVVLIGYLFAVLFLFGAVSGFYSMHKELKSSETMIERQTQENLALREKLIASDEITHKLVIQNTELTNELNQAKEEVKRNTPVSRGSGRGTVFELTAYEPITGGGNLTASGLPLEPGYTVAVDPNVIPLGSKVYIEDPVRPEYSGFYYATDTGGAIVGNIIDVGVHTYREAMAFGRHNARVTVVSGPPSNWKARLRAHDYY